MRKKEKNKKVAVAMSGGVDSSVAAALLKEQGYQVFGVFMRFWNEQSALRQSSGQAINNQQSRENICCSLESQEDARRVCRKLQIPLYTMNMKNEFKKKIVDDFLGCYQKGRTPNPCVRCNQYIKFGEFIRKAKALGADFVATGHYAKIVETQNFASLQKGRDKEKDQTYFLHQLTQAQLKQILFPIGDYTKDQVRRLAKKYGLSVHGKKESQEVCFIPDNKLVGFLARNLKLKPGKIKDISSKKEIGEHAGLALYTIGQRKGIGLPAGPWYVVQLDLKNNILWVSKNEKDLLEKELVVKNVNWITATPKFPLKTKCRIRYRTPETVATIQELSRGKYRVQFSKPQRAITPGQYCVFYKGTQCLGGGEIV